MGLLDGGAAALFSSVFSGFYLDATLHRFSSVDDGEGGGSIAFADEPVKAQLDRESRQVAAVGQTIFVLASGVAEIGPDDEITLSGTRYAFGRIERDPAGAYYELIGATQAKVGRA